jgi:hypothetical protein
MNDDAYRRIMQLERRIQDLAAELLAVRGRSTNAAVPGARVALLQPVDAIPGKSEDSGDYEVSHGLARIYDLITRPTSDPWDLKKVTGDSVDRLVPLANVSDDALAAGDFVFALSLNGIYVNTLGGGGSGSPLLHFVSRSGGIPARRLPPSLPADPLRMGAATCDIYLSDGSGMLSKSDTITIYNASSFPFGANRHGIAAKNDAGLWVAIFEDCIEADDLPEEESPPPPEEEGPPPP